MPRSRALELALRARMATRVARSGSGIWTVPQLDPSAGAGGPRLRWLHVSDFHFKAREDRASQAVLEALILTVQELREPLSPQAVA